MKRYVFLLQTYKSVYGLYVGFTINQDCDYRGYTQKRRESSAAAPCACRSSRRTALPSYIAHERRVPRGPLG